MNKRKIYHLNDRTMKYLSLAQTKRQHQYLGLPGKFKTRLPQEIVFPNLDVGRADEMYYNNENLIIDIEEESSNMCEETLEKFAKYVLFASYMYAGRVYLAVLCHNDPKKEFECYEYAPSVLVKAHYYFFSQNELWEKYENIIIKLNIMKN